MTTDPNTAVTEELEAIARLICEVKGYDPDYPAGENRVQWETFSELAKSTHVAWTAPQQTGLADVERVKAAVQHKIQQVELYGQPPLTTDEIIETAIAAISQQPIQANVEEALAEIVTRHTVVGGYPNTRAIARDAYALGSSRSGVERRCSVCTAIVASYPEGMCCHCHELPWPVVDTDKGGTNDGKA